MLHILWMIIKILLIILACVIGLVLALLLLILFCPIQYYAGLDKEPNTPIKEFHAMAKVAWLFHGITFRLDYVNGKIDYMIRLFGIPVSKLIKKILNKKTKDHESELVLTETKTAEQSSENTNITPDEVSDETSDETSKEMSDKPLNETSDQVSNEMSDEISNEIYDDVPDKSFEVSDEQLSENVVDMQAESEENVNTLEHKIERIFSLVRRIIFKIVSFPIHMIRKIVSIWRSILGKIRGVKRKTDSVKKQVTWYKRFITHPRTKAALSLVWEDGKALIRHILPRKLKGNIVFDSENPSLTGTVLAVIGITIPIHKNTIKIKPLFENKNYLEGYMKLNGRIYGIVFLKTAIQIYFNRNIKFVLRKWKHKEA